MTKNNRDVSREHALDTLLESWAADKRLSPAEAKAIGDAAFLWGGDFGVDWWRNVFRRGSIVLDRTNDFRTFLRRPEVVRF